MQRKYHAYEYKEYNFDIHIEQTLFSQFPPDITLGLVDENGPIS